MKSSVQSGWRHYGRIARRDVHQLLEWGYRDAKDDFGPTEDEPAISGLIVEAMRRLLNGIAPERYDRYFVADDLPQFGGQRTGIRRRRADIVIEWSGVRPRLRYFFEAKRLRRESHPLSAYAGPEGLGRFISDAYAPEASEAGMLAYVQTPTIEDWEAELREIFEAEENAELSIEEGLKHHPVVPKLPHSWVSTHLRVSGNQITLFHIFLDCCD